MNLGISGLRNQSSESRESGFSLLEVMIAMALFFMAIFAILGLTSQSIGAAARLQRQEVDIAGLAAELSLTNVLQEGAESGDFGDLFPGVTWTREITEVSSNGLYRVDFTVVRPPPNRRSGVPQSVETMSILLYRPISSGARIGGFRR
jgi:Tfp pilus assembly protein PilV